MACFISGIPMMQKSPGLSDFGSLSAKSLCFEGFRARGMPNIINRGHAETPAEINAKFGMYLSEGAKCGILALLQTELPIRAPGFVIPDKRLPDCSIRRPKNRETGRLSVSPALLPRCPKADALCGAQNAAGFKGRAAPALPFFAPAFRAA